MEKLDKERYLKRVIVVCWIALAICFGIKLFGGNLFEIMCENEKFIKVCEYADNHFWVSYIINSAYCFACMYFHTLAMIRQWRYDGFQLTVISATVLIGNFVKLINPIVSFCYDIWQGIVMPYLISFRKNARLIHIIIGNLLLIVFQVISLFVKNLKIGLITENGMLIGIIYGIDVFLMVILYYFYSNISKERRN